MRAFTASLTLAVACAPFMACAQASERVPEAAYWIEEARAGAQLRSEIGIVISAVYNPCGTSDVFRPVVTRFETLRAAQQGTPRAVDFEIVRADYDYQMSLVDIVCPEFSEEQQSEADRVQASVANSAMDRIEIVLKKLAERGE